MKLGSRLQLVLNSLIDLIDLFNAEALDLEQCFPLACFPALLEVLEGELQQLSPISMSSFFV